MGLSGIVGVIGRRDIFGHLEIFALRVVELVTKDKGVL